MKRFKKTSGKIIVLFLSLTVMFSVKQFSVKAAPASELWVNGENIINAPDNTVSCSTGTAVYDSSTQTLTLDNATLTEGNNSFRVIDIGNDIALTISLVGDNQISGNTVPIQAASDLTITGSGTLTVNAVSAWGIHSTGKLLIDGTSVTVTVTEDGAVHCDDGIIIKDSAVTAKGLYYGFQADKDVTISNSTVSATSTADRCNAIYILNGNLTIKERSSVTAASKYPALWSKNDIYITDSTANATSTADMAVWSRGSITISEGSDVTARGTNGSIGSGGSFTVIPALNKSVEVLSGDNETAAEEITGSPFSRETDLKALCIGSTPYFHTKTHTHTASGTWAKDASNHWHDCISGDGEKMDLAPHVFGEWIIDSPATEMSKGSKHRECTVCGQRETLEIPVLDKKPVKPAITAGADFTYNTNTGKDMVLTCSGKLEDLTGIYVDDKLVNPDHYTLQSGSTILTLKTAYLDTLSAGNHTLRFQYKGNLSADTTFTIAAKTVPMNPNPPKTDVPKTDTAKTQTLKADSTNKTATTPQTGDVSVIGYYTGFIVLFGSITVPVFIWRKLKNS